MDASRFSVLKVFACCMACACALGCAGKKVESGHEPVMEPAASQEAGSGDDSTGSAPAPAEEAPPSMGGAPPQPSAPAAAGPDLSDKKKSIGYISGQIKSCYNEELPENPTLEGEIKIGFDINENGKVENVTIVSSTMDNQDLEACVIELIGKIAFAPPEGGGTVHVVYPFKFATNP